MRLARFAIALAALGSSPALAENWVTVFEDDPIWGRVDKDSIRRGADNLVYYKSDGPDQADRAADCQKRVTLHAQTLRHERSRLSQLAQ